MAMRVPGHIGRTRLRATITTMVKSPSASVINWTSCRRARTSGSMRNKDPPPVPVRPKNPGICLNPISTAAPALKPRITECETKLRRTPSRARPMPIWIRPTTRARKNAIWM